MAGDGSVDESKFCTETIRSNQKVFRKEPCIKNDKVPPPKQYWDKYSHVNVVPCKRRRIAEGRNGDHARGRSVIFCDLCMKFDDFTENNFGDLNWVKKYKGCWQVLLCDIQLQDNFLYRKKKMLRVDHNKTVVKYLATKDTKRLATFVPCSSLTSEPSDDGDRGLEAKGVVGSMRQFFSKHDENCSFSGKQGFPENSIFRETENARFDKHSGYSETQEIQKNILFYEQNKTNKKPSTCTYGMIPKWLKSLRPVKQGVSSFRRKLTGKQVFFETKLHARDTDLRNCSLAMCDKICNWDDDIFLFSEKNLEPSIQEQARCSFWTKHNIVTNLVHPMWDVIIPDLSSSYLQSDTKELYLEACVLLHLETESGINLQVQKPSNQQILTRLQRQHTNGFTTIDQATLTWWNNSTIETKLKNLKVTEEGYDLTKIITSGKETLKKALLFLQFVRKVTVMIIRKNFDHKTEVTSLFYCIQKLVADMYGLNAPSFKLDIEFIEKISRFPFLFAFLLHTTETKGLFKKIKLNN